MSNSCSFLMFLSLMFPELVCPMCTIKALYDTLEGQVLGRTEAVFYDGCVGGDQMLWILLGCIASSYWTDREIVENSS